MVAPSAWFNAQRLQELDLAFSGDVERGESLGYVLAVAHQGRPVHLSALGQRTVAGDPLTVDTRFRIASLTKPVTAVGVLMLIEQNLVRLDQPVSDFIPAFANVKVQEADGTLRTPARPVLVRDLFTHTSGIGTRKNASTALGRRYIAADPYQHSATLEEAVDTLAALPLFFDPGASVLYGYSTDILGRIIEVASGEPLETYLRRVIFEPLRMMDTSFHADRAAENMAEVVTVGPGGEMVAVAGDTFGDPFDPQTWPSAGAGLISTGPDYLRFAMMLERQGTLDGVQIISPAAVALMTSDHLPRPIRERLIGTPLEGRGFGLAVAVTQDVGATGKLGAVGDFTWSGYYDTQFFVSPHYETVGVLMTQRQPYNEDEERKTAERFKNLVLRALLPRTD